MTVVATRPYWLSRSRLLRRARRGSAKVTSTSAAARSVFASGSFRQYYAGQALSLIGDGLRTLAVPLLVYKLTGSALSTGISYICEIAPFALFGLVGGSLADRLDRRTRSEERRVGKECRCRWSACR